MQNLFSCQVAQTAGTVSDKSTRRDSEAGNIRFVNVNGCATPPSGTEFTISFHADSALTDVGSGQWR
jgi:hypothetical protein